MCRWSCDASILCLFDSETMNPRYIATVALIALIALASAAALSWWASAADREAVGAWPVAAAERGE